MVKMGLLPGGQFGRDQVTVTFNDSPRFEVRWVRLEVKARSLDRTTAAAALQVAGRSLESAQENLRVSRDRYREGVMLSSELLDAETALLRAGLDHTAARAQLRLAQAQLDRAVGR